MHALVTGGAGFIGSHVVDALLERGDTVSVIDNLSSGREENLESAFAGGVRLYRKDVRESGVVGELARVERPDLIVHLAAQIDVRVSVDDPGADAGVNVLGTIAVLEAARTAGVGRVVLASTGGAIYGDCPLLPTPETAPAIPMSGYGQGKLSAEGYLGLYARLHGLSTIALRFANVYGPRQRAEGEGGVVAIVCERVRRGQAVTVFGDGRQTRDFVFVGDVVDAVLAAAKSAATDPLNIGTGRETSVLDLVSLLRALDRPTPEARFAPARAGEVVRSCLDPTQAAETLGWRARTPLVEGLRRTYRSTAPHLPGQRGERRIPAGIGGV
jgi:UDP-glucose 4-epimerase